MPKSIKRTYLPPIQARYATREEGWVEFEVPAEAVKAALLKNAEQCAYAEPRHRVIVKLVTDWSRDLTPFERTAHDLGNYSFFR